jgi:two-component system, LytTR family, response regulator
MNLRTLIVDDEAPARNRVRRLLAAEPDVEIAGEAADGDAAIRAIVELRPALLFLDVQMPAPNGLEVLRAVRDEWLPCTIFTTAHAEHAVAAFELHALDYLLKPYPPERFRAALDRARAQIARPAPAGGDARVARLVDDTRAAAGPVERFLVKDHDRYVVVRAADIEWVEAAANYVILHTAEGNHILRRSLAAIEAELDPRRFFRLGRSAIASLTAVREVATVAAGDYVVTLRSGARLPLTRGLRELQERLQSLR